MNKIPDIAESVEELKSLMGQSTQVHQKQRFSMLSLLRSGQAKNRKQVAELLMV